jgi:hypothetical protein
MSSSTSDKDKLTREHIFKQLQMKPIVPNKTYPLNKENIKIFLSKLQSPKKEYAELIFKYTTHFLREFTTYLMHPSNYTQLFNYDYM